MRTLTLLTFLIAAFGLSAQEFTGRVVRTMDELRALRPLTSKPLVRVLGYYAPGDGGGGDYVLTNTVAGTNTYGGRVLALGGAVSWQLVDDKKTIIQFGAKPDASADVSLQVTAGAYYTSRIREPLYTGEGVFLVTNTITLYRENSLIGPGGKYIESGFTTPGDPRYAAGSFAMFILGNNANCKMFRFDTNGCFVRAVNTSDAGEANQLKVQAQLTIKGIQFNGNCANQTVNNADFLELRNLWNVKIEDCNIVNFRGYPLRVHDCNEIDIIGNSIHGLDEFNCKGIYMWSCADGKFQNNEVGGVLGPSLWLSQVTGWISPYANNKLYNNQRGRYQITGISSDEITTSVDHPYETLDPVEIVQNDGDYSSVFPTGTATSTVYWAIKTASNRLKLATSYTDALNGVAKTISGGSGTNYVYHGTASGLYMSHNASGNLIVGNRMDQNQDSGIVANTVHGNSFVGNILSWNQYDTSINNTDPYPAAGIYIKGVSRNNYIGGNTLQRLNNNFNQAVGIWIVPNSVSTVIGPNTFGGLSTIINTVLSTNIYYEPGVTTSVEIPVTKDNREQVTLGKSNQAVSPLVLRGGESGAPHLRMDRTSGTTVSIDQKVSTGNILWDDVTDIGNQRRLIEVRNDGSKIVAQLGGQATTTNHYTQTEIRGLGISSASGLTDERAGEIIIAPGKGTGAAIPRVIRFTMPVPGASGTASQSDTDYAFFGNDGAATFGLYNGASQTKAMQLFGGSGGASILEFVRSGVATNGIALTTGGFAFREQTGGGANVATITQSSGRTRISYGTPGARPSDWAGSGSPEGAVTDVVGSTYRRTDGGAGTSFYIKESGTGNTGWVAK